MDKWYFQRRFPADTIRDPVVGEFFSTDAIDNPADALIREAIQNSLDERLGDEEIRIHIRIVDGENAPTAKNFSAWFGGLKEHLDAPKNGLSESPKDDDPCPYLVFEDFGTKGLVGDVEQWKEEDAGNSFFYFFRAEGRTGKGDDDRGRWGVGKHVFPRSSRINTFFGLTKPYNKNKQYLMGRTVLKTHSVNSINYVPDGYLGKKNTEDSLVLPVEDSNLLRKFKNDFGLARENKSGLSVIVPFLDDDITFDNLVEAVLSQYFYPILKGELYILLEGVGKSLMVDKDSILDILNSRDMKNNESLLASVNFANWIVTQSNENEYFLNPCESDKPDWSGEIIPKNIFDEVRDKFENQEKITFRVQVKVPDSQNNMVPSFFNVYLWNDGEEKGNPIFIREGIIIAEQRAPRAKGVRSIVVIEDKPLASLLGDSETPAHTKWNRGTEKFNKKYKNGPAYISFVSRSVSKLVGFLGKQDEEEDPSLLIDIFSIPLEENEDKPKIKDEPSDIDSDDISEIPDPPPKHKKHPFLVRQLEDGFSVTAGSNPPAASTVFDVEVAYNTRKGNPLNRYSPNDFVLNTSPIRYDMGLNGLKIVWVRQNKLRLEILHQDFRINVVGFDSNRDLVVSTDIYEGEDD